MKTFAALILLGVALACAGSSARAQSLPDAIAENFFPPELVRMAHPALNLTEEQKSSLLEAVEKVETHLAETRKLLDKENGRLLTLVKTEKVEGETIMAQADRVLRLELETKRATLALLVKIRETLSPEQQAKLREFKGKTSIFQARIRQATDLAEQWKKDGRDLSVFEQARAEFESLMAEGKFLAAEALLDKTLKRLKEPPPEPKR